MAACAPTSERARPSFDGITRIPHIQEPQHTPARNMTIIVDLLCCVVYKKCAVLFVVVGFVFRQHLALHPCAPATPVLDAPLAPGLFSRWGFDSLPLAFSHSCGPLLVLDARLAQGPPFLHAARSHLDLPDLCGR